MASFAKGAFQMKMIALDLSAVVGYAFGDPFKNDVPFSGTIKLSGDNPTDRCYNLFSWCIDIFKSNEVTDVVVELPFIPKGPTSFGANVSLIGYVLAAGMAAKACRANSTGVHQQTWRSQFGVPSQGPKNVLTHPDYQHLADRKDGLKAAKRLWVKDRTKDAVRLRGSNPKDDNEADACAIFYWKMDRLRKQLETIGTRKDLFDGIEV